MFSLKKILNHFNAPFIPFILLFLFISAESNAQSEYYHIKSENFKLLENEQINNELYFEDSFGFIWMGAQYGLARYDVHSIKKFRHEVGNPKSLSPFMIKTIYEDSKGNLWIGTTGGGISLFDREKEEFTHYRNDPECINCINNNSVSSIIEDDNEVLWIGTKGGGLNLLYNNNGEFHFRNIKNDSSINDPFPGDIIQTVYNQKGKGIYTGTKNGLYFLPYNSIAYDSQKFYIKLNFERNQIFINSDSSDISILSILIDKELNLWLGTETNGLLVSSPDLNNNYNVFYNFSNDEENKYSLTAGSVSDIKEDLFGNIWIGTSDGGINFLSYELIKNVAAFKNESVDFINIKNELQNTALSRVHAVFNILVDKTGIVWCGTQSHDFTYNYRQTKFDFIEFPINDTERRIHNAISKIYIDKEDRIWIGAFSSGLNCQLQYNPSKNNPFEILKPNYQLNKGERFVSICEDPENEQFFLVATDQGIYELDKFNWELKRKSYFPEDILYEFYTINAFWIDSYNRIWLYNWNYGLYLLNKDRTKYYSIEHIEDDSLSLSNNGIMSISEDEEKNLWIGTWDGVNFLDSSSFHNIEELLKNDKFKFSWNSKNQNSPFKLPHNVISKVFPRPGGEVWIATFGAGITIVKDYKIIKTITELDGLCDNTVLSLLEDNYENIWIGTVNGLSKYNPKHNSFKNYDLSDGMRSMDFGGTDISHKKTKSGELLFGTTDGLLFIDPDNLQENNTEPEIYITDIKIFNESQKIGEQNFLEKSSLFTNELVLPYNKNFLSFECAALNYTNSHKNQYYYQLVGLNEEWVYNGNRNRVDFQGLSPGDYVFNVKGTNNDGIGNKIKRMKIKILPPFWATWWAYSIYVILACGAIWGFIAWRTSEQKKKIQEMKKVDQLKDQFLANTSHELRTPLQGIIGLAESLRDGIAGKLPQKALENLNMINSSGKRLANLVNDILDFSKLKKHDLVLQLKPVDIRTLVEVVVTVLQPLIKSKDIELYYIIPDDLPYAQADENRVQQILHNLLGNAIKFTEKGSILITAEMEKGMVTVKIKDTGIGIPKDKQDSIFKSFEQADGGISREYGGTGLGLSVSKQLIELHGGWIEVESEPGKGSVFTFTLPVSDEKVSEKERSKNELIKQHVGEQKTEKKRLPDIVDKEAIPVVPADGKLKILVVDDEPVNLQVLHNHLSLEGYHVTLANSGMEAMDLIQDGNKYDLIILDIMMPKLSGYEVCEKLREIYLPSELPVVMLTAKNQAADLVDGFKTGANDYLTKPFSKDELLSRIKTHLGLNKIFKETGKFVPFEFLQYIGRESILDVQVGDQAHKEVTVMFADIRDYTSLAEDMTPEENFRFINSFVGMLGPMVTHHKGFVNQYMGDGIMAIFPKEVEHSLDAAILMQKRISEYNQQRIIKKRQPIKIGIGLHTGHLVMGIIGDKLRSDPATIADSVNTASRLEGMTKHYGVRILLSEESLNLIKNQDKYHLRYLGKVMLKGKNKVIKVFECFDGDEPENIQKKRDSLSEFQAALAHFYLKEFTEASVIFKQISQINKSDKAADYYLKLTAKFAHKGVTKDWSGVDRIDKK